MMNVQGLLNDLGSQMLRNKADQERARESRILHDCYQYDHCRFNELLRILDSNEKLLTHV